MSTRNGRLVRLRSRLDVGEELMGAADAIADMAQRVELNGPEPTYASEKLSHALYKAAEGLPVLRRGRGATQARARGRANRPPRHLSPREGARGARHLALELVAAA